MMTQEILLALAAFAFVSSITPWPNNLMLLASGINFGVRGSLPHVLGVCIGFTVMVAVVGLGVAELLEAVPFAFDAIRVVSVAYLLFLAWKLANSAPVDMNAPSDMNADGTSAAGPLTFVQAAMFQWVNPKCWAMALTAASVFTSRADPVGSALIVALVFGVINLPCVGSWMMLGVKLRRWLSDPAKLRVFNICAALLLVASVYPMVT